MKPINTYVCLVDQYRRPSRQHNTKGRYYVGAKTEKEAKELLQHVIGFGSIQIYYVVKNKEDFDPIMKYKEVKKAKWNPDTFKFDTIEAIHDTSPQNKEGDILI